MRVFTYSLLLLALATSPAFCQLYMTRTGQISFSSKTPMENIDAVNNEVTSVLNTDNGQIAYAVLIRSFHFERALMEEHFNENYMESDKLPKATFAGTITNLSTVNFKKDGQYPATVDGDLTIHGVKRHVSTDGTISVEGNKIAVTAAFQVIPGDYDIEIPTLVAEKIADKINVKVDCQYEPR